MEARQFETISKGRGLEVNSPLWNPLPKPLFFQFGLISRMGEKCLEEKGLRQEMFPRRERPICSLPCHLNLPELTAYNVKFYEPRL